VILLWIKNKPERINLRERDEIAISQPHRND